MAYATLKGLGAAAAVSSATIELPPEVYGSQRLPGERRLPGQMVTRGLTEKAGR